MANDCLRITSSERNHCEVDGSREADIGREADSGREVDGSRGFDENDPVAVLVENIESAGDKATIDKATITRATQLPPKLNVTQDCSPSIGIDLGTTMSAVAFLDAQGRPHTIRSEEGELTTPSAVFFDKTETLVGQDALRAAEYDPGRLVRFAKRHLSERFVPKQVLKRRIPPTVLQSLVLQKLKKQAERTLGPVSRAAITVPAHFNEPERQTTRDAGLLAGFERVDIVNEPTAAAIAFGAASRMFNLAAASTDSSNHQALQFLQKELVLVYDLGGGTFDATIMEIDEQNFDSIATGGDTYLGGLDWDRRLIDHLADQFQQRWELDLRTDTSAIQRLYFQAEQLKKSLSCRDQADVCLRFDGKELAIQFHRKQFELLTRDLLERTRNICRRLLADCGLEWSDLTRLILVGGSSRMPAVSEMLKSESGMTFGTDSSADESVAHGAAIYAGIAAQNGFADWKQEKQAVASHGRSRHLSRPIRVTNINSHDLCVLGMDPATTEPRRQVMIPKYSRLPAAQSKLFLTAKDGQQSVVVNVVEGGDENGQSGTRIGQCKVTGLPEQLPKGSCVMVTFRYSADGRLSIDATLPDVDVHASTSIAREVGMDEPEFVWWAQQLKNGLKLDSFVLHEMETNGTGSPASVENVSGKDESTSGLAGSSGNLADAVVWELDSLLDELDGIDGVAKKSTDGDLSNSTENGIHDLNDEGQKEESEDTALESFLNNLKPRS